MERFFCAQKVIKTLRWREKQSPAIIYICISGIKIQTLTQNVYV
jgi:hypothetical protein